MVKALYIYFHTTEVFFLSKLHIMSLTTFSFTPASIALNTATV